MIHKIKYIILIILINTGLQAQNKDSLSVYIDYGIKNNPKVLTAFNNYKSSYEQIDIVKSLPDPNISAGFFISPIETKQGPQLAKISISEMFPWFETLSAKEKQAAAFANAQYNLYVNIANQTAFQISRKYYDLYFSVKTKEIIENQIILFAKLEKEAIIKFQSTKGNSVDALVFQMSKDELKIQLENTIDEIQEKQENFNILISKNKNDTIFLPDTLTFEPIILQNSDSIISNNPSVIANDFLLNSIKLKTHADRLNTFPKIGLGLDYVFVGKDAVTNTGGKDAIMPMITISLPIFGKKNKAINKSNVFLTQKVQNQKQATVDELSSKINTWQKNYDKAIREYNLYGKLIQTAEQSLQILYSSYSTSETNYDQIILLENSILKYKLAKLNAISNIKIYEKEYKFLNGNFLQNK